MLEKNPSKRITTDELKKEKWLNDGFAVNLDSEDADIFANYTEDELLVRGIPLHSVVIAVYNYCNSLLIH
jgi:hypothetical protein